MSENAEATESTENKNDSAIFEEDKKGEESAQSTEETTEQAASEETTEAAAESADAEGSGTEETETSEGTDGEAETTEEYEISLPEGSSLDPVHAEEIATLGTELGLTGEQAQAWLNRESEIVADMLENAKAIVDEQSQAAMKEASDQWAEIVKSDPEIGGDNLAASEELSAKFVESYFPKELVDWLDDTGLSSHPEAIRGFYRAAKDLGLGGDTFVSGNAAGTKQKKTDAQLFYGDKAK